MCLYTYLSLLADCSENHHVNKLIFTAFKRLPNETPIVPGWNIDVNKGPWTPQWNTLVGTTTIILLSFSSHNKVFLHFENQFGCSEN